MKGDFSKDTFDAKKHFHDVLMQQGRVLLDTDWNEQKDIINHRVETGTKDIIGQAGAPIHHAGFEITTVDPAGNPSPVGTDIRISAGRFYVDGILCENDGDVLFSAQPDFNSTPLPSLATDTGTYIFYLDVWQRHITALEDESIREVALGGPDTTTRSKIIWQVKYFKTTGTVNCVTGLPGSVTNPPDGKLDARTELAAGSTDPCGLVTSGGYRRLENQLYRVEIHKGGANKASTTFKWSRDNGSVAVKWESQDPANPNNLTVSSAGRDELLGFKSGDWIELIDDETDLLGTAGLMAQLTKVDGNVLTINPATIKNPDGTAAVSITKSTKNPRIRRWDSDGVLTLNVSDTAWIALEDGVEVSFQQGAFRSGDYWLIPGRTATAEIEWATGTPQLPRGIRHHYAGLAIMNLLVTAGATVQWNRTSDCRNLFPPVTELTALHYVGGDGQEAGPNQPLPNPLRVGVANGQWPVSGAKVKFEVMLPGGSPLNLAPAGAATLNPASGIVTTNTEGIAECQVTLGPLPTTNNLSLQVRASLLNAADATVSTEHLPVVFNANFSVAENAGVKCCFNIGQNGDFNTLEEAIERLTGERKDVCLCFLPGIHSIRNDILMISKEQKFDRLKITGYAAQIIMLSKRMELSAGKLILLGLDIITGRETNPEATDDTQILLSADETNMDYCSWNRPLKSDLPFIIITNPGLLYVTNSKILGWLSLVLANGIQGVLENNLVSYLLLQNGVSDPFRPVPLIWPGPDAKKIIRDSLTRRPDEELRMTDWSLTIRGNRLGVIVTDVNRDNPKDLYQDMFITDNIIELPVNSFAARSLHITNNQFHFEASDNKQAVVAFAIGFKLIVVGNTGHVASIATNPAVGPQTVFFSVIDTITLMAIRGDGVLPNQLLNLADVIS